METQDIKNLLGSVQDEALATAASRQMCAWKNLQDNLWGPVSESTPATQSFWQSWTLTFGAVAAIAVAVGMASFLPSGSQLYATTHQPNLYTSTFYSQQAEADVVWISGLESSADETENTP